MRVGLAHHALRDVGVQVERHHDGPVRSQHLARDGQNVAFHIVLAFGRLCAVHGQQQRVRTGLSQSFFERTRESLEIRAQQPVRSDRPCGADGRDFDFGAVQAHRGSRPSRSACRDAARAQPCRKPA